MTQKHTLMFTQSNGANYTKTLTEPYKQTHTHLDVRRVQQQVSERVIMLRREHVVLGVNDVES